MTSYATPSDFKEAFGREAITLSNLDDPSGQTMRANVLQTHLDYAASEMDSYLSKKVQVAQLTAWKDDPATAPAILKLVNLDIARYRADRISEREDVVERYRNALRTLRDIANGVIDLGLSPAPEESTVGGVDFFSATETYPSILRGF